MGRGGRRGEVTWGEWGGGEVTWGEWGGGEEGGSDLG